MPLFFGLTTHSSVLKSLSFAATSSSFVALIGILFGASPLAVSQITLPLIVTHLPSPPAGASLAGAGLSAFGVSSDTGVGAGLSFATPVASWQPMETREKTNATSSNL